jgi:hypothetical protein
MPFEISQNTTVQAYSKLTIQKSQVVVEQLEYDDGIEEPTITCDGEYVEINCDTVDAEIWYRTGGSGEFSPYDSPFEISTNTLVQAYATIDNKTSETVSETCVYVPVVLTSPVIA